MERLPPALCASFFVHQLAEEVRSGRVSSQWVNPEDLDVIGGRLACAELSAIHSDVADAVNSLQVSGSSLPCLGPQGSPEVEVRLRGHCEALIAIMPTSLSTMPEASSDNNAKILLREATEDLIQTMVKAMTSTPGRTDRSHEPPSWCASARQDSKSKLTHESGMAATITVYCEALGKAFEVTEPRALRAPAANLTTSLPSHLQSTVADISRSVSLIRAALSSADRDKVSRFCPTTSPSVLLATIETELSRLIAQAEGADEMLSGSGNTIQAKVARLHVAAGRACEVAGRFISCHTTAPTGSKNTSASEAACGNDWQGPVAIRSKPSVKDRTAAWEAKNTTNAGSGVPVSTPMKVLSGPPSGKPLSPIRSRNSVKPFTKKPQEKKITEPTKVDKPGSRWETAEFSIAVQDISQKDDHSLTSKVCVQTETCNIVQPCMEGDNVITSNTYEAAVEEDEGKPRMEVSRAVKRIVEMKQVAVQVGDDNPQTTNSMQAKELGSAGCSVPLFHGISWLAGAAFNALAALGSSVPQLQSRCSVEHATSALLAESARTTNGRQPFAGTEAAAVARVEAVCAKVREDDEPRAAQLFTVNE